MKPTTTPSAKADASVVMGRSETISPSRSSCSLKVSPRSFSAALIWSESASACVEQPRYLVFEGLQLVIQFPGIKHRPYLCCLVLGSLGRHPFVTLDLRQPWRRVSALRQVKLRAAASA